MMKIFYLLAFYVGTTLALFTAQPGKAWRSITPLHSTRSDVERLLGPPARAGSISVYRTGDGLVEVDYATGLCQGKVLGWNVPTDTVLEIHIAPPEQAKLTIDKGKYARAHGHVGRPTYINLKEGVRYEVLPDESVYSISYIPSEADSHLRCPGFPPYDGGLTQYRPFDAYGDIPFEQQEARLDNFAFSLQSDPAANGYVVVYTPPQARLGEALTYGGRAKQYLVAKRKIGQRRLIVLDGGHRQELEVELYLVPRDLPPPTPTPTIASQKVQINRDSRRSRRSSKPRYQVGWRMRRRLL